MAVRTQDGLSFEPAWFRSALEGRRDLARAALVAGAVLIDVVAIACAVITAGMLRFGSAEPSQATALILLLAPPYALACIAIGAYNLTLLTDAFAAAVRAIEALLIAIGCAAFAYFAIKPEGEGSRLEVVIALALVAIYIALSRSLGATLLRKVRPLIEPRVIILQDHSSTSSQFYPTVHLPLPDLSNMASLEKLFRAVGSVDRVVLRISDPTEREHWARVAQCLSLDAEIVEPTLRNIVPIGTGNWDGAPTLLISRRPLDLHERLIKRAFDLGLLLVLSPVLVPVIGTLMLVVKLDSPGPALFVQDRLGRRNVPYRCFKLRTMRHEQADSSGVQSTAKRDARVTRAGRILRKLSLDELPQIINVLRGEMSFVGPRPHALGSTAAGSLFWEITPDYWTRHSMKPGITGLAQVRGLRGATQTRADLEKRVAADLEYINKWSIWMDVRVLLSTVFVVIHRNAY
jgi:polysaccharide biosynthesis protein PslA